MASRMLSRTLFRRINSTTKFRTFQKVARLPANTETIESIRSNEVPIISYHSGERTTSGLKVSEFTPQAGEDVKRSAQSLRPFVIHNLTPTMKKFTLEGKVAIVTGGGRGLGYNMAQALAEAGCKGIAIMDVQQELGDQAAADLSSQTGIDVRFYNVDVRDRCAINEAVDDVVSHFGGLDILISSAGIAESNLKAELTTPLQFRRTLDINVTGTFLAAQACARHLIAAKKPGTFVFIASMSALIVNYPQEQCAYNTSKAAVVQLTRSLAAEWARYGIRVNAISPGYMDTELNRAPALEAQKMMWVENTPMKRLGSVDELNGLSVFLASDASAYCTGGNYVIDGGYTLW